MRHQRPARTRASLSAGLLGAALVAALAVGAPASADPQQGAGVLKPGETSSAGGDGTKAAAAAAAKAPVAKTPKAPETPQDTTWLAPPLPGYVLMFVLGGAVVALNLWSSKRTQLD